MLLLVLPSNSNEIRAMARICFLFLCFTKSCFCFSFLALMKHITIKYMRMRGGKQSGLQKVTRNWSLLYSHQYTEAFGELCELSIPFIPPMKSSIYFEALTDTQTVTLISVGTPKSNTVVLRFLNHIHRFVASVNRLLVLCSK